MVDSNPLTNKADLMKQAEFFSSLLQLVNDLVWSVAIDGRHLLYVNPAAEQIYGRPLSELSGNDSLWFEAVHPDDQPALKAKLESLQPGVQADLSFRVVQPSGSLRWLQGSFRLIEDEKGTPIRIGCIAKDVTKRISAERELEQSQAIYDSLVQSLPINVFRKDREGRIRFGNKRYCKALGKTLEELIGKTDADLFSPALAEKYCTDDRWVLQTGLPFHDIEEHPGADGSIQYVEVLKAAVTDPSGRRVGIQGMFWDVTERKLAEKALRDAKELAESASRAKSDFLANMSHEIRTPMNAILGMTELLIDTDVNSTQREYLTMVQESGESLLSLINDILDFSKIEAGKMELECEQFDIRDRLGDTMRSLSLRAHTKNLELALSIDQRIPRRVAGDVGRLRQVIVNLVGNAIKFTNEGEVVLEITALNRTDETIQLQFTVQDTGIGIPPEKLESIFAEFEQADSSTTRQFGGTGLGLAIGSRLVTLMGGDLKVTSQVGVGSTFEFIIELGLDRDSAENYSVGVDIQGLPILVVDDNATNRRILEVMLESWGAHPISASSAKQAIGILRGMAGENERIPLVLSDVNMPNHDGYDLSDWIRSDESTRSTRIILLTSSSRSGESQRRRDLQIDFQLLKPVKQSDLLDAIANALELNQGTASESPPQVSDDSRVVDPALDTHSTATDSEANEPLRLLLAEDNLVNQRLAIGVLEKYGHQLEVASDGNQAVELFKKSEFDAILMDVQMPNLDGIEATKAIRELEKGKSKRIPIIAMTAHAMVGDRQRCLDAGMDEYVSKPIRIPELMKALGLATGRNQVVTLSVTTSTDNHLVDWNQALETVGGDKDLLVEIISVFLAEQNNMLGEVETAIREQDAKELRRSAHALKGALNHLGSAAVAQIAAELERNGEQNELGKSERVLEDLQTKLEYLTVEFKTFKNDNTK